MILAIFGVLLVAKYRGTPAEGQPRAALVAAEVTAIGPAHVPFTPCWLEGLRERVLCGSYEVYENRRARSGRRISLHIAVLPALNRHAAQGALFVLAGGPGQAATALGGFAATTFDKVREERAIVLVDQRGTGQSNALRCDAGMNDALFSAVKVSPLAEARECLAKLNANPRFYSSFDFADDLDEVRSALGYEKIDLWGGSYGTRAALVYMKMHPDRVRTAVLDGVAPYGIKLPLYEARDAQRSLDLVFKGCNHDEKCHAAFPDLRERFAAVLSKLERSAARVSIHNPRTGEPMEITVTRERFAAGIRGLLYSPSFDHLVPLVIEDASQGNFGPLVALATEVSGSSRDTMSTGLTLSVLCSEDVARIAPQEEEKATKGTFLGNASLKYFKEACSQWPRTQLPPNFDVPAEVQTPTLLLSGELDPITPPEWAREAAAHIPNSVQIVVPGAAHNVSSLGCMPDVIASFVKRGSTSGLDTSCASKGLESPFFTSAIGGTP